jgi:predicted nucleotidyltransferase
MKCVTGYEDEQDTFLSPLRDSTNRQGRRKTVRKRKRKSSSQLEVLSAEFQMDPEWDKGQIARLMKKTGLSEAQIYKWGWDQKKKITAQEKSKKICRASLCEMFDELPEVKAGVRSVEMGEWGELSCAEAMAPGMVDFHFYKIQKAYKEKSDQFKQDNTYKKNLSDLFESFIRIDN